MKNNDILPRSPSRHIEEQLPSSKGCWTGIPTTTTLISLSGMYLLLLYCLIYGLKVECHDANEMMEARFSPLHSRPVYGIDDFWHAHVLTSLVFLAVLPMLSPVAWLCLRSAHVRSSACRPTA